MSNTIVLSNHKGGVGKTTSAINLAAGLNKLRKKVLLVDLDPQANLTLSLGIEAEENNIYLNLKGIKKPAPVEILKNWDLIPSHIDLSGAEIELTSEFNREYKLKKLLDPFKDQYDYIIIDSPPSLALLTINCLTAADYVLLPLQAQFLAMQGLTKLLEVIDMIKEGTNPNLKIAGVFITQYDSRKVLNRNVNEVLGEHFKGLTLKTMIRDNIALAEAPAQSLDIFRYNPKSYGAEDYLNLAKEIKKIIK